MRSRKMGIKGITAILAGVLMSLGIMTSVKASNDSYSYQFTLRPHYANSYSSSRYRQTTDVSNKWKVNLQTSTEGKGTKATFWLSNENHKKASETHTIAQGSGSHYYNAYSSASKRDVCLSVENNNDSSKSYKITGVWDEETN
ncbi:MAG: DUF2712 domain-containing protein [Anaerostipes sp.]|nr:DUF2712 domain-containing protein [Anaerostipes sp.]